MKHRREYIASTKEVAGILLVAFVWWVVYCLL